MQLASLSPEQSFTNTLAPNTRLTVALTSGTALVSLVSSSGSVLKSPISATTSFGPYDVEQNYKVSCLSGVANISDAVADQIPSVGGNTIMVSASRNLLPSDNGNVLKCTTSLTLTAVADTLPADFGCAAIPSGTLSLASSGGTNLNGATTTLTRTAASNPLVGIVYNGSLNDFIVTGS